MVDLQIDRDILERAVGTVAFLPEYIAANDTQTILNSLIQELRVEVESGNSEAIKELMKHIETSQNNHIYMTKCLTEHWNMCGRYLSARQKAVVEERGIQ